jgi:hypothetical protein
MPDARLRTEKAGGHFRNILRRTQQIYIGYQDDRRNSGTRLTFVIVVLIWAAPAGAQELGNKVLGALGLLAGSQPGSGLYVADRFLRYSANELIDRNGHPIPVGLDLDAVANAVGVQVTFPLPWHSIYVNASVGVPAASISVQTDRPEAGIDRYGLGDFYVQPVKIGWKLSQIDIVAGYAFYAPTGRFTPRGGDGVGRGYWTHQFSLGSAVYFDRAKTWHISELASYDLNQRKRGIDLTRGDTVQVQGGAGKTLGIVDVGVAGYALWQVRDDRGSALPEALRGARDRAFGLGPEVDVTLAPLHSRITLRYCHDIAVRARPLGEILVIGLTVLARR